MCKKIAGASYIQQQTGTGRDIPRGVRVRASIKDEAVHIPLFQPPLIYASAGNLTWTPHGDSIIDLRSAAFT